MAKKKVVVQKENIRFTVTFNIPVDPTTDEYIVKLTQAAFKMAETGLEVHTTHFQLPPCMDPRPA